MHFLKKKSDYDLLRKSTNKRVSKLFLVVFLKDERFNEPHFGITVSKKVGHAVVRNKVKRRIRAFLRNGVDISHCQYSMYNIIALPSVVGVAWDDFCDDLTKCLSKI